MNVEANTSSDGTLWTFPSQLKCYELHDIVSIPKEFWGYHHYKLESETAQEELWEHILVIILIAQILSLYFCHCTFPISYFLRDNRHSKDFTFTVVHVRKLYDGL